MKVTNPFLLNDWNIRPFLIVIISVQFAFLGSVGLDFFGFSIPLLRQILGFLFLTFVPGILLLRILQMHRLGTVRTIVYSVSLSLSLLMVTGFFMNTVYPFFGITHPISLWPFVFTISGVVVILVALAYLWDLTYSSPDYLSLQEILSPPVLALSLLPFGAIAGTYLMNFYGTNILLMVLLPIVALVPVVLACTRYLPEKYYSYAIFSVALTLLYHSALISMYIWGWDIQYEYYLTNIVIQNGFWDPSVYSICNAMLSLVMLVPFYSIALNLGMDWVFKIIFPFLFALVPLGLYAVFKRQTTEKIAFLGCFFFMSLFVFYTEMLSLARQEIAELFLVLIILSIVDRDLTRLNRAVLFLAFSMSLIVSHYGLSYLFLFILFVAWILVTVGYYVDVQSCADRIFAWMQGRLHLLLELNLQKFTFDPRQMPFYHILFYGFFILIWYIYMSSSSSFDLVVKVARHITTSIVSELLNPDAVQGLAIITTENASLLHEIGKYLQLLTIFFIVIGFGVSWVRYKDCTESRFDSKYLFMAFGALCLCIGGVALPYFASALNTSRLYQICLIFLAPFSVVGGMALFSGFRSIFGKPSRSLQFLSVFLGIFLLFNCGWIYEFAHDNPTSFALNNSLESSVFNEGEICGAMWLIGESEGDVIYCDMYNLLIFRKLSDRKEYLSFPMDSRMISRSSYLFYGTSNIDNNEISLKYKIGVNQVYERRPMSVYTPSYHSIYNSKYSLIYYRSFL